MNTVAKIGLVTVIGALIAFGYNYAKKSVAAFTYSIVGYGSPSFSGAMLQVPITVAFNNPTPVAINIDNLHVDIFIQKLGQWTKVASIDEALSLPQGASNSKINPQINLASVFSGGIASTLLQTATQILQTKSVPVRTEVTATYAGVTLPKQTFTNNILVA